MTFSIKVIAPGGRISFKKGFTSWQAAMNKKIELMTRTQEDDTEYYIVHDKKGT